MHFKAGRDYGRGDYPALYPRFGYRRIHVYLEREGGRLG